MSRSFDTWLVHDHHDFNELRRLCHNLRIKLPDVAISKLDLPLHHIPEHHRIPADAATSLLAVVSCSEPSKNTAVMNQIIDVVRKPSTRSAFVHCNSGTIIQLRLLANGQLAVSPAC